MIGNSHVIQNYTKNEDEKWKKVAKIAMGKKKLFFGNQHDTKERQYKWKMFLYTK